MKLLLDTHVFLWAVNDDSRASSAIESAVRDVHNQLYGSIASFWEMAIKASNGKLAIPERNISALVRLAEQRGTKILPVLAHHLDILSSLPKHHKDPFDRLIISQAMAEDMVLLSVDLWMRQYDLKLLA